MSDLFKIEIPITLAVKVEKTMREKKCTLQQAVIFLVEKVSTPLAAGRTVPFLP